MPFLSTLPTTPTARPPSAVKKTSPASKQQPARPFEFREPNFTNIYVAGMVTTNSCQILRTPSIVLCEIHPESVLLNTGINPTAQSPASLLSIINTSGFPHSNPYTAQFATAPPDGIDAFGAIYPTHSTLPATLQPACKHMGESTATKAVPTHRPPRNTPANTWATHAYLPSQES